jgi:hypothetical protein
LQKVAASVYMIQWKVCQLHGKLAKFLDIEQGTLIEEEGSVRLTSSLG